MHIKDAFLGLALEFDRNKKIQDQGMRSSDDLGSSYLIML